MNSSCCFLLLSEGLGKRIQSWTDNTSLEGCSDFRAGRGWASLHVLFSLSGVFFSPSIIYRSRGSSSEHKQNPLHREYVRALRISEAPSRICKHELHSGGVSCDFTRDRHLTAAQTNPGGLNTDQLNDFLLQRAFYMSCKQKTKQKNQDFLESRLASSTPASSSSASSHRRLCVTHPV